MPRSVHTSAVRALSLHGCWFCISGHRDADPVELQGVVMQMWLHRQLHRLWSRGDAQSFHTTLQQHSFQQQGGPVAKSTGTHKALSPRAKPAARGGNHVALVQDLCKHVPGRLTWETHLHRQALKCQFQCVRASWEAM